MFDPMRTKCAKCGKNIIFIQTVRGKFMPCDDVSVRYVKNPYGYHQVMTEKGQLIRCDIVPKDAEFDGFGYLPHWASCGGVESMERYDRKRTKAAPTVSKPKAEDKPKAKAPDKQSKAGSPAPAVKYEQISLFLSDSRERLKYLN